jgi:hypothetical protein
MTVIPSIISGSTILSRDTWNEYIKVTSNMTETAIQLRRKKQLQLKMMKLFAMKSMREMLGAKDDLSEEMIENMGMEEMLSNLEGDFKIEMLQIKRASNRKNKSARYAAMTEEEKAPKRKRDAARYAAMSEVEKAPCLENKRKKSAASYAEEKENINAQKRKKRAENTAEEKENINAQRRKKRAEKKAAPELVSEEKENINAQKQKKRAENTA